jgi:hypothetical protein
MDSFFQVLLLRLQFLLSFGELQAFQKQNTDGVSHNDFLALVVLKEFSSNIFNRYVWSVIGPMMKVFVGCSDLIILLMAVDRFRVMKNIDQLRISEKVVFIIFSFQTLGQIKCI